MANLVSTDSETVAWRTVCGLRVKSLTIMKKHGISTLCHLREQYKVLGLIERSLCRLLGFRIYGVHVNGFTKSPETGRISKMWIARRSLTKQTYPGLLDNVVS